MCPKQISPESTDRPGIRRRELIFGAAGVTAGFLLRPLFRFGDFNPDVAAPERTHATTLAQANASRSGSQIEIDAASKRIRTEQLRVDNGMEVKLNLQHSSGLTVRIYSDGDILTDNAPQMVAAAVGAGLAVLDSLPEGEYKAGMQKIKQKAARGAYTANELEYYISSKTNTVWSLSSPFDQMQPDVTLESLAGRSSNGVLYQAGPYYMVAMNPAAIDGRTAMNINGLIYENTPEEKTGRELSHEALHFFEALEGLSRNEPMALMIESALELEYRRGSTMRPLPFQFS